ncbi:MAG TPA: phosphate acyltransferase, partial [Candidatus Brocadiia bacterium]|nr:phosphate acyltransferase [Candidatus Brocadiia bacterium]
MSVVQRFVAQAQSSPRRIVFPEGFDPRVVQAARRCADESVALPIVLGDPAVCAAQAGVSPEGIDWIDMKTSPRLAAYAQAYAARRGVKPSIAQRIVTRDLYFACMMVACGDADGYVGGVANTTANLLAAAGLCIGPAPGVKTPSSIFIMDIPARAGEQGKLLVFADCAMNIDPTADQLADIAVCSARTARALLGIEPRVAMLSFSTRGSASHPLVDKVRQATELARKAEPELAIDGELQGDAALAERVAKKKAPDSKVA